MDNIIATKLFETDGVSAFKIPSGSPTLSKWDLSGNNILWTGCLRAIEQELVTDSLTDALPLPNQSLFSGGDYLDSSRNIPKPYNGLRLKLELYNTVTVPPTVGSLTTTTKDLVWAEIWYNPAPLKDTDNSYFGINSDLGDANEGDLGVELKSGSSYTIANNGEETIQGTESSKYYKIISQIPESGYHPYDPTHGSEKVLQVALGLKFDESFNAVSFAESLAIYKRRYRNFEDQYNDEHNLLFIETNLKKLTLSNNEYEDDEDDDDNDISVGSYYNENRNLFSYGSMRPRTPSPSTSSSTDDYDNEILSDRLKQSFTSKEPKSEEPGLASDANRESDNDENDEFGDFVQSA